ncbi:septum formation protein Maf [bacterium]|nr:MAG: septum formation protein Maf [bacterium]
MRTIILASQSKARQELLRQIGLKFKVAESNVKEISKLSGTCADLVVKNALSKAQDVAGRLKGGVVVGADTVVWAGNKIIGKPKNMKDAIETLKLLSKKPQWVYTGIAVVDIDNAKAFVDYEKTKIYMYHLTDRQIRNYFKRVSPLDKSGSFDIQGLGSVFIDRIEGCFYNVVGLPLAKLARLLNKAGVDVF